MSDTQELIAQPYSPLLELPVEALWARMADMERGFHTTQRFPDGSGSGVDLVRMSANPVEYRKYIEHCRALRIKTRKPKEPPK